MMDRGFPPPPGGIGTALTAIERYEYKYRIHPALVPAIRDVVRQYCEADAASAQGPYLISTLYLDSPNRVLYRRTKEGLPRRFKLRARRYESGPVFLEIKARERNIITKHRVGIAARLWPEVMFDSRLVGQCGLGPADTLKLQAFLDRCLQVRAEPAAVVRYAREAYISRVDDYARVTFDYRLEGRHPDGYAIPIADQAGWLPLDDPERFGLPVSGVILELKSLTGVPLWMTDLVTRLNLQVTGNCKYTIALEAVSGFPRDLQALRAPSPRAMRHGSWT